MRRKLSQTITLPHNKKTVIYKFDDATRKRRETEREIVQLARMFARKRVTNTNTQNKISDTIYQSHR